MFKLESPEYFILLVIPIIILALFLFFRKRKNNLLSKIGDLKTIQRLFINKPDAQSITKMLLVSFGLSLIIIGLINPQWGTKRKTESVKGIDLMIALDVSNSMLAMDILPNRLERAKKVVSDLISELKGNRIGLIVFAGNAYLQVPLTTDYSALDLTLEGIQTDLIPTQGTEIGEVFKLTEQSFDSESKKNKALVIITDGENHDEGAIGLAKTAGKDGLKIIGIGIGTDQGGYIPDFYRGLQDYKRDENGSPILTKLNKNMIEDLSAAGAGSSFFIATNQDEKLVKSIAAQLDSIEKKEFETAIFTEFESYFQIFIFLSFFIFFIEYLLPKGKKEVL
jgi:Ca-activated chloride channel family protein